VLRHRPHLPVLEIRKSTATDNDQIRMILCYRGDRCNRHRQLIRHSELVVRASSQRHLHLQLLDRVVQRALRRFTLLLRVGNLLRQRLNLILLRV
jgi:hypothetical protein